MAVFQYWTAFAAGRGLAAEIGPEFASAHFQARNKTAFFVILAAFIIIDQDHNDSSTIPTAVWFTVFFFVAAGFSLHFAGDFNLHVEVGMNACIEYSVGALTAVRRR